MDKKGSQKNQDEWKHYQQLNLHRLLSLNFVTDVIFNAIECCM